MVSNQPTERPRLVVWGASGHARVVADVLRRQDIYEIVGFIDDVNRDRHGMAFCGSVVLGGQEQLAQLKGIGVDHILIAIGDCSARLNLAALAHQQGFHLADARHPRSTVADVCVGSGTVIMAGAVINPGSVIGENVIVNTGATMDHDCALADGVHVGPGVHLGGHVKVGRASTIGIGAVVKDRVTIGSHTLIGAGSAVVSDIPDGVVAYGVPARVNTES